jgi:hypothetical protein
VSTRFPVNVAGQTGRSMDIRLKEHQCHIWLEHLDKSALVEHSINQGHIILFHDASILATSTGCVDHIVRETIEVVLHPFNMNRKDGFSLSRLWKHFICSPAPILVPHLLLIWPVNVTPPPQPLHIILCHCGNLPHR